MEYYDKKCMSIRNFQILILLNDSDFLKIAFLITKLSIINNE